jgi:hypothetical protein
MHSDLPAADENDDEKKKTITQHHQHNRLSVPELVSPFFIGTR